MANGTNQFDFSVPLADFLAQVYDDATVAAVIQALKQDKVGYEAPASAIAIAGGQLWSNLVDDFMLRVYGLNPGRKNRTLQTVGALTDAVVLATLTTNGQVFRMRAVGTGRTATQGEVASAVCEAHFYRNGGTVIKLDPTHTIVTTGALAGVDLDWDIDGDDVRLLATGIVAKTVDWDIRVDEVTEVV